MILSRRKIMNMKEEKFKKLYNKILERKQLQFLYSIFKQCKFIAPFDWMDNDGFGFFLSPSISYYESIFQRRYIVILSGEIKIKIPIQNEKCFLKYFYKLKEQSGVVFKLIQNYLPELYSYQKDVYGNDIKGNLLKN